MPEPSPGNKAPSHPKGEWDAVRKALAYADDILATLREPFLVLDSDLRVKSANNSFCKKFHVSKAETEKRLVYDLGDGQWDIPGLRNVLDEVLTERRPVNDFEVQHDFPAIGQRAMLLNARQFPPEAINPELILLAIEDVTERRKAEAVLREKSRQYRRLFEAAQDGILILDADTDAMTVIDANPFMTELLGYSHDEFLGKELWEIGFFEDKAASQAAYRELHENGYLRYEHPPLKKKNGQRAEVEFICNTYQVDGKRIAQCNIRDIEERSRLERQATAQAAALADQGRRKDEFLAMLAHELRNPLAPICNGLQILRLTVNSTGTAEQAAEIMEVVEIMEKQTHHITRLVEDLLDMSRITTGKIELRKEPLELAAAITSAAKSVRPFAEARQHKLTVLLPREPVMLAADPTRLEQVLVNLLNNAVKFTKPGGHICLTAEREGEEAVVRLKDTGTGMSADLLPHVFDLFTQAQRTLDRSEGGLGIGLTMVKRLVELHGGSVEAHSPGLNQGSEFVVRLPALPAPPKDAQAAARTGQASEGGLRVLIVEDVPDVAKMLGMLLQVWGYKSRLAYDGPTGLMAFRTYQPDVVLCDIGLPGMSGYDVAGMMRKEPRQKRPLLVAMTGYCGEEDKRRSHEAGFDFHMTKPADPAALEKLLSSYKQTASASA